MRHLYYDQHGKQIPAALALDANGILREGVTQRVSLMMRDGVTVSDAKDPTAGCRPGFRLATIDAAARDAREAARREYLDYITSAYKQPQRVRDQDTRAGKSGLVDHDEPTHFSRPRITDGTGDSSELAFSRPGWRMLADASVNNARETAYAEYLHDLTTAWRCGAGKEDVVPDSPRASCNDAVPVPDIETAYRLYCEEISQAWKRPR